MQNFSLGGNSAKSAERSKPEKSIKPAEGPVDIRVSGIFDKEGKKIAYVSFKDGDREAEGIIPDCRITRNQGFSGEEKAQLEAYMERELASLKKMASGINVMKALMD